MTEIWLLAWTFGIAFASVSAFIVICMMIDIFMDGFKDIKDEEVKKEDECSENKDAIFTSSETIE